jgi:antitoxin HicB
MALGNAIVQTIGGRVVGSAVFFAKQTGSARVFWVQRRQVDRIARNYQEIASRSLARTYACKTKVEGTDIMTDSNQHIGSTFESWLDEQGIREEVTAAAIKAVISNQLAAAMKANNITKSGMAAKMQTSRAQLDRLLDPDNGSVTLETLQRAAKIVGREIRLELV